MIRPGFAKSAFAGAFLIAGLAACGTTADEKRAEEFADAEAVLAAGDSIAVDPALAAEEIVIPPALANESWTQVAGEAEHSLIHVEAPQDLVRAWRARLATGKAKGAPVTAPPIVGADRLYYIDAVAAVRAVGIADGREVWTTVLTPDVRDPNRSRFNIFAKIDPADLGFGGGIALDGDRLFVTSGYGFVAALDAATGELLWQTEAPGPMRNPPTAANGRVIAVSISNEVIALDQETGEEQWTFESFEEAARVLGSAAPAVSETSVVVPFSSGEVASLDVATGRLQWQSVISRTSRLNALSTLGDIAGSPVVNRGAVFAVSQSGQMAGIDLRTGQVAWENAAGGFHTPWLAGQTLFVLTNRGELAAINSADGLARWVVELPAYENERRRKGRITWAGPVLAGGRLYLSGTSKELLAVSPQSGEVLERYRLKDEATQPPIVAGNTVYVLTEDGSVEAFRAARTAEDEQG